MLMVAILGTSWKFRNGLRIQSVTETDWTINWLHWVHPNPASVLYAADQTWQPAPVSVTQKRSQHVELRKDL